MGIESWKEAEGIYNKDPNAAWHYCNLQEGFRSNSEKATILTGLFVIALISVLVIIYLAHTETDALKLGSGCFALGGLSLLSLGAMLYLSITWIRINREKKKGGNQILKSLLAKDKARLNKLMDKHLGDHKTRTAWWRALSNWLARENDIQMDAVHQALEAIQ